MWENYLINTQRAKISSLPTHFQFKSNIGLKTLPHLFLEWTVSVNQILTWLSQPKQNMMLTSSDADILQGCWGGWRSRYSFTNFLQGECSPDDRELTITYVKNMIFIKYSGICLSLRYDHIWCGLLVQVNNIIKGINVYYILDNIY